MGTWVKLEDKTYVHLDNGSTVDVYTVKDDYANVDTYAVRVRQPNANRGIPMTLQSGYSTKEEAYGALDEFMSSVEFIQVAPPVTEEEKSNDNSEGK